MMMFGGSPTRVAVPPMLEASTSAIRNGAAGSAEPLADQERHRRDQQHGGDVVQQRRGHRGDHAPACTMTRNGRPRARLTAQIARYSNTPVCLQHADDQHHPEQQEDDVPVDAGVFGEERVSRRRWRRSSSISAGPAEGGGDPVDLLGGDQDVGDQRTTATAHPGAGRSSLRRAPGPAAPCRRDRAEQASARSTTATSGLRVRAISAAISSTVASGSTTGSSRGSRRQGTRATVRPPSVAQEARRRAASSITRASVGIVLAVAGHGQPQHLGAGQDRRTAARRRRRRSGRAGLVLGQQPGGLDGGGVGGDGGKCGE